MDSANREFDAVYAAHHQHVLRHATRLVGADEAPDVAQRVWLKVFLHLDQFRGRAKPGTWLYVVTRNAAMDVYRRRSLRALGGGAPLELARHVACEAARPDARLLEDERRAIIDRRIRALSAEHQAMLLAWLSGFTVKETAEAFGLHPSTVKSRTHRARVAVGCSAVM